MSADESEEKRKELLEFVEHKYEEIAMNERIEEQLALPERLSDLKPEQFPLFVTV